MQEQNWDWENIETPSSKMVDNFQPVMDDPYRYDPYDPLDPLNDY
jgi:hypothetical protein